MPRRTQDPTRFASHFGYRACTFSGRPFNAVHLCPVQLDVVLLPRLYAGLGSSAFARHYLRNHFCFLFLQVLRCFNSLGCTLAAYVFCCRWHRIAGAGFPHSDTPGSLPVYGSPRRFAVCCVLLLLYMPRHPPYALLHLITTYREICFRELLTVFLFLQLSSVFFFSTLQKDLSVFSVIQFSKIIPLRALPDPSKPNRFINQLSSLHIFLLRKEVIHPHVLVGIPCYDLTPIISPTFDGSFTRLGHRLRVLPTLMV